MNNNIENFNKEELKEILKPGESVKTMTKEEAEEILKNEEKVVTSKFNTLEFCAYNVDKTKTPAKIIKTQGYAQEKSRELTFREQLDILCPNVIKNALMHRLDAINARDNRDYNKYSNRYYLLRSAIEEAERQSALEPNKPEKT